MRVRATKPGFFGVYREQGDEFEVQEEKQFSKQWMEKVSKSDKKKTAKEDVGESEGSKKPQDDSVI